MDLPTHLNCYLLFLFYYRNKHNHIVQNIKKRVIVLTANLIEL